MNISYIEAICNLENFKWAWNKVKRNLLTVEPNYNEVELFAFELKLEDNLTTIIDAIKAKTYNTKQIHPIAVPKPFKDEKPQTRQLFAISLEDQLVWIAILNIIGPLIDNQMPFWSYGSRLYKSLFKIDDRWIEEFYQNSSGKIYRTWNQSWPLFRKHVGITAKLMGSVKPIFDEEEHKAINDNEKSKNINTFLKRSYWSDKGTSDAIFWANLDLTKFFQSIEAETIEQNIESYLKNIHIEGLDDVLSLIKKCLKFKVNVTDWINDLDVINLSNLEVKNDIIEYSGIPTGLIVGGFLANISMKNVDERINEYLRLEKLSIFRYVDDFTILSSNFDLLIKTVHKITEFVEQGNPEVKLNTGKTKPIEFAELLHENNDIVKRDILEKIAINVCKIDPAYPKPLMTKTLNELSMISKTNFDLLDNNEQKRLINELIRFTVVDLPDEEIKKETLLSFSIQKLMNFVPKLSIDIILEDTTFLKLYKLYQRKAETEIEFGKLNRFIKCEPTFIEQCIANKNKLSYKEITNNKGLLGQRRVINHTLYTSKNKKLKYYENISVLIERTVFENFSKLKLWSKLIRFYRICGLKKLDHLKKELSKISPKLDSRAYTFLLSYISRIIAYEVLTAYSILQSNYSKNEQRFNAKRFIIDFKRFNGFDYDASQQGYQFHKDMTFYNYIRSLVMSDFLLKSDNHVLNSDNYSKYLLWYYRKVVIQINLVEITPEEFKCLLKKDSKFYNDFDSIINKITLKINHKLDRRSHIYLEDWIVFTKNCKDSSVYTKHNEYEYRFDIRLSEWMALKIVLQIIDLIISKENPDPSSLLISINDISNQTESDLLINPQNILIPASWIKKDCSDIDWKDWEKKLKKNPITHIHRTDNRTYRGNFKSFLSSSDQNSNYIYSLGLILADLLSMNLDYPKAVTINSDNRITFHQLTEKLSDAVVSSYTLSIIESCLSVKNKEKKLIQSIPKFKFIVDEIDFSDLAINNIDELKNSILAAIKELECYQISIYNLQYRQIVPLITNDFPSIISTTKEGDES